MRRFKINQLVLAAGLLALGSIMNVSAQPQFTLDPPQMAKVGDTVTFHVQVPAANLAAVLWTIQLPDGSTPTVTPVAASGKGVACNGNNRVCIAWAMNKTVIPAGPVATYTMQIPLNTPPGQLAIPLTIVQAVDPSGTDVPVVGVPSGILILSNQDLNGDGKVDSTDVQLMLDEALGRNGAACIHDLNGDGKCDLKDVFRVILAALGF